MKLLVALTVIFSLLASCHSKQYGGRRIFVATSTNGLALAQQLSSTGVRVHGFYDDVVVISSAKPVVGEEHFTNLGRINSHLAYFVLERQQKQYDHPIKVNEDAVTLLYSSFNRVIVSVQKSNDGLVEYKLDLASDDDLEILPINFDEEIVVGIREELREVVAGVYANATAKYIGAAPNLVVQKLVALVDPAALKGYVTYLTGEDPSSNILTRNSRSQGAKDAAVWIGQLFQKYGLTVSNQVFRTDYSSNVIGIKRGVTDPSKIVVVGAHYDSRGPDVSSTTQRAPGANDNGSGTGAVLQIAKIFSTATFDYTIHFIVYSGEEQGLYGSAAYAQQLIEDKADVIGVLNADMIAYRAAGEKTQCAFPSRYSTLAIEDIAKQATALYVPELTIGTTNACCSDHQSYYTRGIPATGFFERNGAIADVQYHKSGDLVNRPNYDIDGQYTQLTKAITATLAILAGAK